MKDVFSTQALQSEGLQFLIRSEDENYLSIRNLINQYIHQPDQSVHPPT